MRVKPRLIHVHSKFSRSLDTALPYISINDVLIEPRSDARNLGVIFDHHLSSRKQINSVCSSAYLALSNISKIRRYLDRPTTEKLVHAFISSRLDQCNSLYYGLPDRQLQKLQRVQNSAARVVAFVKKQDHITPVLQELHWLPINARIEFKLLLLTFKSLNNLAPVYLNNLIPSYITNRTLRSSNKNLLNIPKTNSKTYGDRAFSVAAPRLWNALPLSIRSIKSFDILKSNLKTFLFKKYYC